MEGEGVRNPGTSNFLHVQLGEVVTDVMGPQFVEYVPGVSLLKQNLITDQYFYIFIVCWHFLHIRYYNKILLHLAVNSH